MEEAIKIGTDLALKLHDRVWELVEQEMGDRVLTGEEFHYVNTNFVLMLTMHMFNLLSHGVDSKDRKRYLENALQILRGNVLRNVCICTDMKHTTH